MLSREREQMGACRRDETAVGHHSVHADDDLVSGRLMKGMRWYAIGCDGTRWDAIGCDGV